MMLGYLRNSQFTGMAFDTSKIYWGVEYEYGTYPRPDSFVMVRVKRFVADFVTGEIVSSTAAVEDNGSSTGPAAFTLNQNYPNPFNPTTVVSCQLPEASDVQLVVYDLLGREVARLLTGRLNAGVHSVRFDGSGLASGVYCYRLQAGTMVDMKRMILIR